jgi:hypothetical protein
MLHVEDDALLICGYKLGDFIAKIARVWTDNEPAAQFDNYNPLNFLLIDLK